MSNENAAQEAMIGNDPFNIDFSKVEAFSGGGAYLPKGEYETVIYELGLKQEEGADGRHYVQVSFKVQSGEYEGQVHNERVYMPKASGKLKEILQKAGYPADGPTNLHELVASEQAIGLPILLKLAPNGKKSPSGADFMGANFDPIEGAQRVQVGATTGTPLPGQAGAPVTTTPGAPAVGAPLPGMPQA